MSRITGILAIAALTASVCTVAEAQEGLTHQLYINEIMQSQIFGDVDMLMEIPDSWVELYNPGNKTIKMEGWSLGKNKKYLKCYQFPDVFIEAGGYLLVYCDKEDIVFRTKTAIQEVHADFQLSNLKEDGLYLFNAEHNLVDSIHVLPMPAPQIAYGRETDGSERMGYMLTPTPGKANEGGLAKMVLPDPKINTNSTVYSGTNKSQRITMSVPRGLPSDVTIHYTVDNTEPDTAEVSLYSKAIYITESTVLKAALFADSCLTPPALTKVYLFHDGEVTLPVVSVTGPDAYFNDKQIGIIYANNKNKRDGTHEASKRVNWRRPVQLDYFANGGGAVKLVQGGEIRVSGAYSRDENFLKSFILYADSRFGTADYFRARFWPTTSPYQIESLSIGLRDGGNDFNNTFMRDGASQIVFGYNTNLDWQGYQPSIFYINGEYQGIINIRERANEDYVWAHYDGLNDITVMETGELKKGDIQYWNDFVDFYSAEEGHTYAEWDSIMDLEEFTNFTLANVFFSNTDFPANNNVAWRPNADGGKWRWILKDLDRAMGIWGSNYAQPEYNYLDWYLNMRVNGSETANSEYWTRLLRRLMMNEQYKNEFIDRYSVYLGDFLVPSYVQSIIEWCRSQMEVEIPIASRNVGTTNLNSWTNEVNKMKDWATKRNKEEYKNLASLFNLGNRVQTTVNKGVSGAAYYSIEINGIPLTQHVFDGWLFAGRDYEISSSDYYDKTKAVIGWEVTETSSNGGTNKNTVMEPVMKLTPSSKTTKLEIKAILGTNGVQTVDEDDLGTPERIIYYNAQGVSSDSPFKGLNVVRYFYENGNVRSEKVYLE